MYNRVFLLVLGLAALGWLGGCASVEPRDFAALQSQVYRNTNHVRKLDRQVEKSRRPQAEITAEVDSLRQEISRLRGQVEENSHNLGGTPRAVALLEAKTRERLDQIENRLTKLESYLGFKAGSPRTSPPTKGPKITAKPKPKPSPARPKSVAQVYKLGRRLYKKKSYQAARDRFREVLKKHPKSKYAASAHYWVGETYFAQKKYEEAILAYNQVIKRYSKSSKARSALLKQGLAFARLGDKRKAKIVLKKLVRGYPKSNQAKTARRVLKKMK